MFTPKPGSQGATELNNNADNIISILASLDNNNFFIDYIHEHTPSSLIIFNLLRHSILISMAKELNKDYDDSEIKRRALEMAKSVLDGDIFFVFRETEEITNRKDDTIRIEEREINHFWEKENKDIFKEKPYYVKTIIETIERSRSLLDYGFKFSIELPKYWGGGKFEFSKEKMEPAKEKKTVTETIHTLIIDDNEGNDE